MMTRSRKAYICDINDNRRSKLQNDTFKGDVLCAAKNAGFDLPKKLGFDSVDISLVSNDVVFGICDRAISVLCQKNNDDHATWKHFEGKLSIYSYGAAITVDYY